MRNAEKNIKHGAGTDMQPSTETDSTHRSGVKLFVTQWSYRSRLLENGYNIYNRVGVTVFMAWKPEQQAFTPYHPV